MRWGYPLLGWGVPHMVFWGWEGDPFPSKKCLRIAHPDGVIKNDVDSPVPTGPFWAILGVFLAFSGHLGLLDVILDQCAAAGTSHAHNCAS